MKITIGNMYHVKWEKNNERIFEGVIKVTHLTGDVTGDVVHVINNTAGWQLEGIYVCDANDQDNMFRKEITQEKNPEYWL